MGGLRPDGPEIKSRIYVVSQGDDGSTTVIEKV